MLRSSNEGVILPETVALLAMERQIKVEINRKSAARCRQLAAVFRERGRSAAKDENITTQQVWLECAMLVSQLGINIEKSEDPSDVVK